MKSLRQRISNLFMEPEYRTKLLVFVLIGVVLTLSAILTQDPFWREVILQIAITFATVAFVQILWAFLGGDPVEVKMSSVETQLSQDIQSIETDIERLKSSLHLLRDLMDGNIGIERIWQDRNSWRVDADAGLHMWQTWLCEAKDITIISNTLWNNWLQYSEFRQRFFTNLERGATIKIVLYDPDSEVLKLRASDERDPKMRGVWQMQHEIGSSLSVIANELERVSPEAQKRLEVRLTDKFLHYFQIIRADERMLICLYMAGKTGSSSPTFQLQGAHSIYFDTYQDQFDEIWKRGKPTDLAQLHEIVRKHEAFEQPAVEA